MNAAAQIIADLDSRGVSIRPDGDLLRLSPRSALTDADRENLRALKTEVLAELHRPSRAAALSAQTRHEPGRLVTHPWIGSEVNDGEVHGILRVVIADYNGNLRAGIRADGDAVLWLACNGAGGRGETYTLSVRPAAKAFSSDQEIEGRLRIADTDYWEFEAEAGDVMTFASGTTLFAEKLIVRDPDLNEVWSRSLKLDQTSMGWNMIVRKPGRYLVAVSAQGDGASGTYTLNRQVFGAREFDKDRPAKGDFSTGQTEIWKFTARPDEPLMIHWESSNWSYSISVLNESGVQTSLQRTRIDERNSLGILKVSRETTYVIVLISTGKPSSYSISLADIPVYVKDGERPAA
ncbi:MAG: hypothetical protein IH945_08460 [Armatimonadetes bacterium]|nr:hypothetical protein [Armatimonadota bacterium]